MLNLFLNLRVQALVAILLISGLASAQVPQTGNDTLLDIACWNMEWFGDATSGNGPSDEPLQFNNVKQVLANSDIDVWGLEEVSHPTVWSNLMATLPAYGNTIATYSQTQKTALIWKKDKFDMISSGMVLNTSACDCYYEFASGRYPLEVVLKTKNSTVTDTIYFYVIHLKAFSDQASYDRRKAAAGHLKAFLDTYRAGKKVVVLGDWNDELLGSTVGSNPSPFDNLQSDTARYFFISRQLSDQFKKSYASSNGRMIDHIMISKELKKFYRTASSKVLDNLPTYISGYNGNTSDHYPVMGFFDMKRYTPTTALPYLAGVRFSTNAFPNPNHGLLYLRSLQMIGQIQVLNSVGQVVEVKLWVNADGDAMIEFPATCGNGIYFVRAESASGGYTNTRILLQR